MLRTDSRHIGFLELVAQLNADLAIRDGEEHGFYDKLNSVESLKQVVVLYDNDLPVACGAMKQFEDDSMEIKRMFVRPRYRGTGLATEVLSELEKWAVELGFTKCILETGKRQPEAVALYRKNGYYVIDNYGPYEGVENSVCFRKELV